MVNGLTSLSHSISILLGLLEGNLLLFMNMRGLSALKQRIIYALLELRKSKRVLLMLLNLVLLINVVGHQKLMGGLFLELQQEGLCRLLLQT